MLRNRWHYLIKRGVVDKATKSWKYGEGNYKKPKNRANKNFKRKADDDEEFAEADRATQQNKKFFA